MSDRHIRRSGFDYGTAFLALLPQGQAWPKRPGTILDLACRGLSEYWGFVDSRAADLLEQESDPRRTLELLLDWERNWGLPDPCYKEPLTIDERHDALIARMTMLGGCSRQFFIDLAGSIGYTITISEFRPFVCGIDHCGDSRVYGDGSNPMLDKYGNPVLNTRGVPVEEGELSAWPHYGLGPMGNRFYWTVHVSDMKLVWFRCGSGQCGVDPHLRIGLADDLECLLNRWKPAHTIIIFDYSRPLPPEDRLIWFRCSVHQCGIDPHLRIIPTDVPSVISAGVTEVAAADATATGNVAFAASVNEATAAVSEQSGSVLAVWSAAVVETATATSTQDATLVSAVTRTAVIAGLSPMRVGSGVPPIKNSRLSSGTSLGAQG